MRRLSGLTLLLALLASAIVAIGQPAGGQSAEGACTGGHVEVRGIVRDAATGLPLPETANVDYYEPDGTPIDGGGTGPDSRHTYCAPIADGDIKIRFDADNYRPEWWNDQPDLASATVIDVNAPGPIVVNAALTPDGRVIAGRVTNMAGASRFASIGIFRRNAAGNWIGIDGIGNDMPSGKWSFRVPSYGRYRVGACVDYHWCRFAASATRLRFARTIVVNASTVFINDVDIRVPYCHATPDFCVPPGFDS